VDAVAKSIQAYGFQGALIVDEHGVLLAGHTRLKAALKLGMKQVPVQVALGLTPEQCRAFRLADNKLCELSTWNDDLLIQELLALQQTEGLLDLTGFSSAELDALLADHRPGPVDPDTIPEPPDEAITRRGDLWQLGRNRLLCGDCGQTADVDRLLDGAAVHLVAADPPDNWEGEPRSNSAIAAGLSSFDGAGKIGQEYPVGENQELAKHDNPESHIYGIPR